MFKAKISSFKPKIEPRRLITAGGTLVCALGIGYLMQHSAPTATPRAETINAPDIKTEPVSLPETDEAALDISDIVLTSALPALPAELHLPRQLTGEPIIQVAFVQDEPVAEMPAEEPAPAFSSAVTCDRTLTAEPVAAAMVSLVLAAPCMPNERFTIHHNGMMFSDVTDETGRSVLTVPALSEQAIFIASFADGEGALANAEITSLEYFDRVVVQWSGESGLQIHALEYGSDYGDSGHVWSEASRDNTFAARGEGGFLTRHGARDLGNALLAEVYTFPTGLSGRDGDIRLSVEAEVTAGNCGRDIEAQSIQMTETGRLKVQEIVLAIPDCNAVGDFLVLKNLLNDLKIARN